MVNVPYFFGRREYVILVFVCGKTCFTHKMTKNYTFFFEKDMIVTTIRLYLSITSLLGDTLKLHQVIELLDLCIFSS